MLAMDHVEAPLLARLPLPYSPHIVVAGAYKGDTVRFLLHHYPDAHIRAYEPQLWAWKHLPVDDRVDRVSAALLAMHEGKAAIMHSVGTDACSLCDPLEETENTERREVFEGVDAAKELEYYREYPLSLMVLNVEGYEYTLLPYLFENGIVPVRLLVQFHHYQTHEAAAFAGVLAILQREYSGVNEVGKGWWYCS